MTPPADLVTATVYPYREKLAHGNIVWADCDRGSSYYPVSKYAMRNGRFPVNHPVAPNSDGRSDERAQCGTSEALTKFRERGYWASCFPEGDGITWKPERGQSDDQCLQDIRECFPQLAADWGRR